MDQRAATQKHRDDLSIENLCLDLALFLSQALQDARTCYRKVHATEHAKSLDDIRQECDDMVFAKIEK